MTRTPLRLTLGGGGTDLPAYCLKYGGFLVTSALDKHIYLVVKPRFQQNFKISYSIMEIVNDINEIKHPVVREGMKMLKITKPIELFSMADVPAETGLGSSGSFTVSLLHALHTLNNDNFSPGALAGEASYLGMTVLKEVTGVQDYYIAAFGGFICLDINSSGTIDVFPLKISEDTIHELEDNMLFFYTGVQRPSAQVLKAQSKEIEEERAVDAMHKIKKIGYQVKTALERGDTAEFGRLQHEHWIAKKSTSTTMSTGEIDRWYNLARENGAVGGKIMGAGGGGFLMLYCENGKGQLRKVMAKEGLAEVRFRFERGGSRILLNL
jgi:D-glycero-alpha-D-manno-heptose-7-phosphate kinase